MLQLLPIGTHINSFQVIGIFDDKGGCGRPRGEGSRVQESRGKIFGQLLQIISQIRKVVRVGIREVAKLLSLNIADPYRRLILRRRGYSLGDVVLLHLLDLLDLLEILLLLQL